MAMKYFIPVLFLLAVASCETPRFDPDRRQIIAKDEIRSKLGRVQGYDITAFKEDTVRNWPDSTARNPVLYSLDFIYKDSTGTEQHKKGEVLFTPDGKSVLSLKITDVQMEE